MRERVAPDDRLVRLHRVARQPRDQPARARDLGRLDPGPQAEARLARVQQHHDLLQRRVAGALADPVDRALDLPAARFQPRQRVGDGQAEVVVAVHRERGRAQIGHQPVELREHRVVLARHRVADRVGHIDRRGALVERDLDHLGHVLDVRARAVLRRELDVVGVLARLRDRRADLPLDVLARGLQLVLDVHVAGGEEGVNPRPLGVPDRLPGGLDVLLGRARQTADHGAFDLSRDRLHRLEVAGRGDREAGLDHIDAQPRELVGDLQLFLLVQRDSRRLLAVAQGRVEDLDAVCLAASFVHLDVVHVAACIVRAHVVRSPSRSLFGLPLCWVCGYAAATRYSPRGGSRRRSERDVRNDICLQGSTGAGPRQRS